MIIALVYFGAAISSFACALASINAFGRTLFSLGRYQILHSSVGLVHGKFKTPHVAVTIGAIINFVAVALLSGNSEIDTFGWYGTIASFGFIVVYFLVSVAAPVYLKKTGELTTGATIIGGLGAALMVLALVGSVYPVPAFPYNLLPYGFAAYLAARRRLVFRAEDARAGDAARHRRRYGSGGGSGGRLGGAGARGVKAPGGETGERCFA